jgi:hypothetical protein
MRCSYADLQALPQDVYEVLVADLTDEANQRADVPEP